MTTAIDVRDLHRRFDEVLAEARASGAEIIVTQDDRPAAKLVPLPQGGLRVLGLHPGTIQIADDFDAPLDDSFWMGEP